MWHTFQVIHSPNFHQVNNFQTYKFGQDFAAIMALTMAVYTWFTVRTTLWRSVLVVSR